MRVAQPRDCIKVAEGLNLRLTKHQVQALCDDVNPDWRVTDVTYIPSGLNNAAFLVNINREFDVVLRVVLEPSPQHILQKEIGVYELMRARGIPVPGILKAETNPQTLRHPCVLSTYVPGNSLSNEYASLGEAQKVKIYAELGDYVGRLHAITFDAFGEPTPSDRGIVPGRLRLRTDEFDRLDLGPFSTWQKMFSTIVGSQIKGLRGSVFDEEVCRIERYIESRQDLLEQKTTPCLLHMDLHMGNIRVGDASVTGILDPAGALIGHNEYCLMRMELANFRESGGESCSRSFFAAYSNHIKLDEGYAERKPLYELSRHLVGMQCVLEFGGRYAENASEMKAKVHAILERA